jgi:hypothetical protein
MTSPWNEWKDDRSSERFAILTVHCGISAYGREAKKRLSANYSPSMYSVTIGRGKLFTEAIGTRRLKVIASLFLAEYNDAKSQIAKASIITKIIDIVREACPVGAFVRYEDGSWWEVSDAVAREKVGVVLRDLLHDKYKSSTKAKSASRKNRRKFHEVGASTRVIEM